LLAWGRQRRLQWPRAAKSSRATGHGRAHGQISFVAFAHFEGSTDASAAALHFRRAELKRVRRWRGLSSRRSVERQRWLSRSSVISETRNAPARRSVTVINDDMNQSRIKSELPTQLD